MFLSFNHLLSFLNIWNTEIIKIHFRLVSNPIKLHEYVFHIQPVEKDIEDILDKIDMWEYQKIVEIHDRFEIPKWFQEKDSDSNWWKCNFTKGSNWYI